MLYEDNTTKLLGLEDVIIKNVWEEAQTSHIEIILPRQPHKCPMCGMETETVHDYREQQIRDVSSFGK